MDQLQDNEYIRVTHEKLTCFLRVLVGIFQLRGCKDSNLCKIIINNNVATVYLITSYMCVIIPYYDKAFEGENFALHTQNLICMENFCSCQFFRFKL